MYIDKFAGQCGARILAGLDTVHDGDEDAVRKIRNDKDLLAEALNKVDGYYPGTQIFFSDIRTDKMKYINHPGASPGMRLAALIKKKGLGKIKGLGVETNPQTGNKIEVWRWVLNEKSSNR